MKHPHFHKGAQMNSTTPPDPTLPRSPLTQPVSLFQGAYDTTVVETVALQTVLSVFAWGTTPAILPGCGPSKQRIRSYKRPERALLAFTPACALTHTGQRRALEREASGMYRPGAL